MQIISLCRICAERSHSRTGPGGHQSYLYCLTVDVVVSENLDQVAVATCPGPKLISHWHRPAEVCYFKDSFMVNVLDFLVNNPLLVYVPHL